MIRRSIIEYAEELKKRSFRIPREEKGKMLDEFTQVTGLRRKAASGYCIGLASLGQANGAVGSGNTAQKWPRL